MGIVAATGCNTVFGSTYPFNPYLVPWTNSLFENAPAVALGIRARWDAAGHPERRLWVVGGDGAMYDIGFQSLSRMVASGADIKVLVLDTQVYSNTGGQASTATFGGQVTKLSAFGKALHGRPERRKELGRILMAHGEVYVAQTTPAHLNHFYRAIMEANEYPGPAVRGRLHAVHARARHRRRRRDPPGQARRRLAGVPALHLRPAPRRVDAPSGCRSRATRRCKDDWATVARRDADRLPRRSPGPRAASRQHFAADGTPTPEILATQDDRLANWRALQELAGMREVVPAKK